MLGGTMLDAEDTVIDAVDDKDVATPPLFNAPARPV